MHMSAASVVYIAWWLWIGVLKALMCLHAGSEHSRVSPVSLFSLPSHLLAVYCVKPILISGLFFGVTEEFHVVNWEFFDFFSYVTKVIACLIVIRGMITVAQLVSTFSTLRKNAKVYYSVHRPAMPYLGPHESSPQPYTLFLKQILILFPLLLYVTCVVPIFLVLD